METTITATELARSLSDVLNRVRYRREKFSIVRNGELVATLAPATPDKSVTLRELAAALQGLEVDGEEFARDLEEIQASQPEAAVQSWPTS